MATFFGSIAGIIVGAVQHNAELKQGSGMALGLSLGIGLGIGESTKYPRPVFEDRLVYVRP